MERLSVDYGKKSKLEFAIYPAPQVDPQTNYIVIYIIMRYPWHIVGECHTNFNFVKIFLLIRQ